MKYISLLLALLLASMLFAEPEYVPYTTMAEHLGSSTCGGCAVAWQGLQVPLAQTHNGEFFVAKLYTQSGDLTTDAVLDRFNYYEVIGIPAVIFNGKTRVNGSGDGIADGSMYNSALNQYRYSSSPLQMSVSNFSATSGEFSGEILMVSPTLNIVDAKVVYYLLEDNITASETHVVRSILYDDLNLSGNGSNFGFNKTFSISPAWNAANLWAVASVQLVDKAILQNVSTLPLPTYNLRAAMDWNMNIMQAPTLENYNSPPFWLFNMGTSDNYTTRIVVDSAPAGWYFNYCDEEGNCYVGDMDVPLSLSARETKSFHLNMLIGSPGVAYFRFVVSSPNIGSYSIPFRYVTEGTANSDDTLIAQPFRLGNIYPNPVKQNAEIMLNSNKSMSGTGIDIFNLKGQMVQSVPIHKLNPGENRIAFSADKSLPNGVYFYKISGTETPARKFILMK
ncbi:MAG: hypothetical protein CVU50_09725 [Candidatus Cloacimonetes bacterium HGW-Cloacimonetes-3]|jgi:hypothetical protein|nr:MAG: hypothetical protein CVU50_09725 [Candidatus Cloacimonetes bacterium HGW-Cloacimonetes-3]